MSSEALGYQEVERLEPPGSDQGEPRVPSKAIEGRSPWRLAYERLRHDKVAITCVAMILLIVVFVVLAPVFAAITGHGPNEQFRDIGLNEFGQPQAPSGTFVLGTDDFGRDLLVRLAYGGRISLLVGVVATAIAVSIGVVVGLASGIFGGVVDATLARLIDVVLSFPFLLFGISMIAVFGASTKLLILVVGIFSWAAIARIVRGQVISLREREYVAAARSMGASDLRIMFVDLLPNVLPEVIVLSTLLIPITIVAAASLSFLGLGIPPPTASWGNMINEALPYYREAWWFIVFPGLALLVTTLAFNLLGDSVRDALDPRGDRLYNK